MKKLLLAMAALAALSLLAPSTGVAQDYNQIGIYTTQDANPDNASYTGAPGQITAYVVVTNPRNYNLGDAGGEADITVIGGFEFALTLPASAFLLSATLPPNSTNFSSSPNFVVGTNLPVTNSRATLLTLLIGEFTGTAGYIYIAPHPAQGPGIPSIPGSMAITDFNDDFRLNRAYPASGDYANPVFGLYQGVTPNEDASWSELKTLFR